MKISSNIRIKDILRPCNLHQLVIKSLFTYLWWSVTVSHFRSPGPINNDTIITVQTKPLLWILPPRVGFHVSSGYTVSFRSTRTWNVCQWSQSHPFNGLVRYGIKRVDIFPLLWLWMKFPNNSLILKILHDSCPSRVYLLSTIWRELKSLEDILFVPNRKIKKVTNNIDTKPNVSLIINKSY